MACWRWARASASACLPVPGWARACCSAWWPATPAPASWWWGWLGSGAGRCVSSSSTAWGPKGWPGPWWSPRRPTSLPWCGCGLPSSATGSPNTSGSRGRTCCCWWTPWPVTPRPSARSHWRSGNPPRPAAIPPQSSACWPSWWSGLATAPTRMAASAPSIRCWRKGTISRIPWWMPPGPSWMAT